MGFGDRWLEALESVKEGHVAPGMQPALNTQLSTNELFTGELEHWHYDTFRTELNDPFLPPGFVTFEFDSWGSVTGFKIDLPNPDFHFKNLHFIKINKKQ